MCAKILNIPPNIRYRCLHYFVEKCWLVHCAAFFQWRLMYPREIHWDPDELIDLISTRVTLMYKDIEKNKKYCTQLKPLRKTFFSRYKRIFYKSKPYHIYSFE